MGRGGGGGGEGERGGEGGQRGIEREIGVLKESASSNKRGSCHTGGSILLALCAQYIYHLPDDGAEGGGGGGRGERGGKVGAEGDRERVGL